MKNEKEKRDVFTLLTVITQRYCIIAALSIMDSLYARPAAIITPALIAVEFLILASSLLEHTILYSAGYIYLCTFTFIFYNRLPL